MENALIYDLGGLRLANQLTINHGQKKIRSVGKWLQDVANWNRSQRGFHTKNL